MTSGWWYVRRVRVVREQNHRREKVGAKRRATGTTRGRFASLPRSGVRAVAEATPQGRWPQRDDAPRHRGRYGTMPPVRI